MKKSDLTMLGIHDSWHDDFIEMNNQGILTTVLSNLGKYYLPDKKSKIFRCFGIDKNSIQVVILIGGIPNPDITINSGVPFASLSGERIEVQKVLCDAIFDYTGDFYTDRDFDTSLQYWLDQGVFLLNNSLTSTLDCKSQREVWKPFIQFIVECLNKVPNNIVWALLGESVYEHEEIIDLKRNIIKSVHPMLDRFDTSGKFVKTNIFEKINEYYNKKIEWVKTSI